MRPKWTILAIFLLWGSSAFPGSRLDEKTEAGRSYHLMSDRSIYVAGEQVMIRVFNLNPEYLKENPWSTVYYLELISPDGVSFNRTKLPLNETGASGILELPGNIPSGTYFLEGYTRWMRNIGPAFYQYISIEVINPRSRELLPVDTSSRHILELHRSLPRNSAIESILSGVEASYSRRELVELELTRQKGSTFLDCCITVARKGALASHWENRPDRPDEKMARDHFLPETQGITLTGKVEERGSGEPAPYAVVYLSSLGTMNEFYATHSDSSGRFFFALKEGTGEMEYFISSSMQDETDLELKVDQDFSGQVLALPSFPLTAIRQDPGLVSDLSMNVQISEQYLEDNPGTDQHAEVQERYFYGKPGAIIRFEDFIRLPDLEEYFKEVIPQVSIRKSGGTRTLRVHGDHPDLQFFPPLMMVDGVAIFDVESILSIAPRYVDRIEIIRAPYIRGNVTFGGIVHLITRNGNMGYIDLPSSGLLLNYKKFSDIKKPYALQVPDDPRIPDTRNTLFWEPSLVVMPGETRKISFYTPDQQGTYEIWIRGYGPNANSHEERIRFRVE